jgi:hypothetical protein
VALAREIALNRGKVSDPALAAAAQAGLSTEAVLDVLLECAFATLVGLIDNLAGHIDLGGRYGHGSRDRTAPAPNLYIFYQTTRL